MNLEARLRYLIQYPHGCLEQTTSAAFPQLYLGSLLKLEDSRKREIENNIRSAIERLRYFQRANGSFSYWAGGSGGFDAPGASDQYSRWSTTYAGHFLIEAERAGYTLPPSMKSGLVRNLRSTAASWKLPPTAGSARDPAGQAVLDQTYRLYVLALAGSPDVGAMNRLRESVALTDTDRWMLAASYKLAGLGDVATALTRNASLRVSEYTASDYTFGSTLRDRALLLQSLVTLGRLEKTPDLVRAISAELASEGWYSTQSVSFSLLAMAKFAGSGTPTAFGFERRIGDEKPVAVSSRTPLHQEEIKAAQLRSTGTAVQLRNTSQRVLFVTLANRGVPPAGADEASSAGIGMEIAYTDEDGQPIDVAKLAQGTDLIANVTVKNLTALRIDNIALTQIVPAGWEIHNERLENVAATGARDEGDTRRSPFAPPATAMPDHVDIRDDRVLQYFGLKSGETIRFKTRLNAAYLGRYYLPSVSAEAMYDATKNARSQGQWVQVVTRAP